jgi:hypothetical protein
MTGLVAFLLLAALGPPPGKKGSNTFRQEGRRSDSRPPPAGNVYTLSLTLILVLLILAYYIT